MGDDVCDNSGGVGSDDIYKGKAEPVLDLVLDSYSNNDSISICDSRPSSCPAYTY